MGTLPHFWCARRRHAWRWQHLRLRWRLRSRGTRATCSREPSFVVVKEMCSLPITISSSCRPTRSGIGQLLSSSFISCAHDEQQR